jgi:hypothetical protein
MTGSLLLDGSHLLFLREESLLQPSSNDEETDNRLLFCLSALFTSLLAVIHPLPVNKELCSITTGITLLPAPYRRRVVKVFVGAGYYRRGCILSQVLKFLEVLGRGSLIKWKIKELPAAVNVSLS